MCEYLGYTVTKLERIRIMNVKTGNLPLGHWRKLTKKEITDIFKLLENSTSNPDTSFLR